MTLKISFQKNYKAKDLNNDIQVDKTKVNNNNFV